MWKKPDPSCFLSFVLLSLHGHPAVVQIVWEALPHEGFFQFLRLQQKFQGYVHDLVHLFKHNMETM